MSTQPITQDLTSDGSGPRIPLPTWAKNFPGEDTPWESLASDDVVVRDFDVVSFPSIGEGYHSAGVAVGAQQHTDGHIEKLYVDLDAPGVQLSAGQARAVAEQLLTAADALDVATKALA